jgi:1-deoxy-D-xylulose-5-phosphate reductoisomerase
MQQKNLVVLGATGSIGTSTLDLVTQHPDRFRIFALSAHQQIRKLSDLCQRFLPKYAVVGDLRAAETLQNDLKNVGCKTEVLHGERALAAVVACSEVDIVVSAIVGSAGLLPTLAAIEAAKTVLLANKESLVMAGELFVKVLHKNPKACLLPLDSEHSAIFQSLPTDFHIHGWSASGIRRFILTASGGPCWKLNEEQLQAVTPQFACRHPKWQMGKKISVDSATLMNKGLEVIEAHYLFNAPIDAIDVLIHPQSIIHSMVEYVDGSVMAQMGYPDMRTPIAYALAYPHRISTQVPTLDLAAMTQLTFAAPDHSRFPALSLAYDTLRQGGTAPAIFNAANEIAVAAFLNGNLGFTHIVDVVAEVLQGIPIEALENLEQALEIDEKARQLAAEKIRSRAS